MGPYRRIVVGRASKSCVTAAKRGTAVGPKSGVVGMLLSVSTTASERTKAALVS
jgi:hypothetical protein